MLTVMNIFSAEAGPALDDELKSVLSKNITMKLSENGILSETLFFAYLHSLHVDETDGVICLKLVG